MRFSGLYCARMAVVAAVDRSEGAIGPHSASLVWPACAGATTGTCLDAAAHSILGLLALGRAERSVVMTAVRRRCDDRARDDVWIRRWPHRHGVQRQAVTTERCPPLNPRSPAALGKWRMKPRRYLLVKPMEIEAPSATRSFATRNPHKNNALLNPPTRPPPQPGRSGPIRQYTNRGVIPIPPGLPANRPG